MMAYPLVVAVQLRVLARIDMGTEFELAEGVVLLKDG